jgi:hypothetical protein
VGHACSARQTGIDPDFSSLALLPGGLLTFLIAACTPAMGGALATDPEQTAIFLCASSALGNTATATIASSECAGNAIPVSQALRVGHIDLGAESTPFVGVPRLTVPEPTVLALIALGLLGIARAMRKRTNCQRTNGQHAKISAPDAANRQLRHGRSRLSPTAHRGDED